MATFLNQYIDGQGANDLNIAGIHIDGYSIVARAVAPGWNRNAPITISVKADGAARSREFILRNPPQDAMTFFTPENLSSNLGRVVS